MNGSILYGTTFNGGDSGDGVIFSMRTDGTSYSVLHSFSGSVDDGACPAGGSLAVSGSTLYGMTMWGGSANHGAVYSIGADGSGFRILHSFTGGSDGGDPWGGITLSGSTLYGMTNGNGNGTIFKIDTDGTDYSVLHSFAGGSDGRSPFSSLIINGETLYGTAAYGGPDGNGTVFEISTDGSGFEVLHSFTGGTSDGAWPYGTLMLDGSTLYGTTYIDGSSNGGTVFSIPIPEPSTLALFGIGLIISLLACVRVRFNSLSLVSTHPLQMQFCEKEA